VLLEEQESSVVAGNRTMQRILLTFIPAKISGVPFGVDP